MWWIVYVERGRRMRIYVSDKKSVKSSSDQPNPELIRRQGWRVNATIGSYCVAWRGREEVVLVWREGSWHPISGTYRETG